jgi:pyruvate kinase
MLKRTKIVATISDKKCDVEFIRELFEAGMNVVRLNTAHQSLEQSKKVIDNVRAVSERIAILVDTKGPEIRTSAEGCEVIVDCGTEIRVYGDPHGASGGSKLYVTYEHFVRDIPVGSLILIDDGEIEIEVLSKESDCLVCKASDKGVIKNRKSVNTPNISINLPSISEKDKLFIDFAIENNLDFIAHSFVRDKEDIIALKNILEQKNSPIRIIAKIENQQGVDNIDEILEHTYGIMVARGDLGIEIPAEKIPVIQRMILRKCIERAKPVIIATQMLHSMIEHPRPTRAEVSDVANAIYQRTDALMLSGETAYGKYPVEAVKTMTRIAQSIEPNLQPDKDLKLLISKNEITAALAESAVRNCCSLPVEAIITDTLTGRTALYLAAFRGVTRVYTMCYKPTVMRQLALTYGIYADTMELHNTRDSFLSEAISFIESKGKVKPDDLVLVIGGSFGPTNGASFMEISEVRNLLNRHY